MMKWKLVLVLLLPLFFQEPTISPGPVVLVGGGPVPKEAVDWMRKHAHPGNLVVITYQEDHKPIWQNLLGEVDFVSPEEFSKLSLEKVGAICIDGGDQWKYLNRIDSKVMQSAHEKGIPILGTSAGAMILGEHYFTAEKNSITSEEAMQDSGVCLGSNFLKIKYLKGAFVDSHYSERRRRDRLIVFIKKSGADVGYGIDEGTALCLHEKETVVFGKGNVDIIHRHKLE